MPALLESLEQRLLMSTYSVVDLGMLSANDVNNAGQVVGMARYATGDRATLWQDGIRIDLGTLGNAGSFSSAAAISNAGHVVGDAYIDAASSVKHAFLVTPEDTNGDGKADRWYRDSNADGRNDLIRDLGTLGLVESYAFDVNASGVVVGEARAQDGAYSRAFVWRNGVMINLGTMGGASSSASAINDAGQVVGWAYGPQNIPITFLINPEDTNGDGTPDRWSRDVNADGINDLMVVLPGFDAGYNADINASGQITGSGALWTPHQPNGTTGTVFAPDPSFAAYALNNAGVLVGATGWGTHDGGEGNPGYGGTNAAILENGVVVELFTRIPVGEGVGMDAAAEINDQGWIVGNTSSFWNGLYGAGFLLIPSNKPSIHVSHPTVSEDPGASAQFMVTLSNAYDQHVTVNYATVDGSATAGADYQAVAGVLTFAPGETAKSVHVAIHDDVVGESTESFQLQLSNPMNAIITYADYGVGTAIILDNEPKLSITPFLSIEEGNSGTSSLVFNVTLSTPSHAPVSVNYRTSDGEYSWWYYDYILPAATAGSDYQFASGTLTFNPGQTAKTITVAVIGDTVIEDDEYFSLDLFGATGAEISSAHATGLIIDNDTPPSISIYNDYVSVVEGHSGVTPAVFNVSLSRPAQSPVTVHYATADGAIAYVGSAKAGSDYQAQSGVLTFAPGETTKTITILVKGDREAEFAYSSQVESFSVNLSNASGAVISYAQTIGWIVDDDPTIAVIGTSVVEGNTGSTQLDFSVVLSLAYDVPVTVHYATADGTAKAGSDYQASSGSLTFAPGQTSKTLSVSVNGDRLAEPNETFFVNLSNPNNAAITNGQGIGNIVDDEPRISISDVNKAEGKKGSTTLFTFTVSLAAAYDQAVTMSFRTVNGTAKTSNKDYVARTGTITFAPGETTKTITIQVIGDSKRESNETFYLDLFGNSGNSLFKKSRGIGTILNDD